MTLAGYGNDSERVVTGVADPIYTACVAIRGADGNTVLIFAADLLQAKDDAAEPVKELVHDAFERIAEGINFVRHYLLTNMNQNVNVPIYALSFGDVARIFGPREMFDTNAMAPLPSP